MMRHRLVIAASILMGLLTLAVVSPAPAHITPPVLLVSDRDAVAGLLTGARRFFVREVRLSPEQRRVIQQQTGWTPDEDFYRFYIGRDGDGRLTAVGAFLTEFTIHGPVRVAVGLGPDGKVRGVTVVEVTEETYPWVKAALDRDVTRAWIGQGSHGTFTTAGARLEAMPEFYTQVIASLVRRAAVLHDVVLKPAA